MTRREEPWWYVMTIAAIVIGGSLAIIGYAIVAGITQEPCEEPTPAEEK